MVTHPGLEGIVVAETVLSHVDGEAGSLILRGRPVAAVGARGRFEDALALLWTGSMDDAAAWEARLGAARVARWPLVARAEAALDAPSGIEALRGALGLVHDEDPLGIVAAAAVVLGAWVRRRQGEEPIAPDAGLAHAADLLRMMGAGTSEARARGLGTYLATVADHGMNASTFAARVVTSTGSDAVSAVVAALGALKGPLHGGAPGPVLDMLDAVGTADDASAWVEAELVAGRRMMGMGHRVYRVRDPRAAVLEEAVARLAGAEDGGRLALARAVEAAATEALAARKPDRRLRANVEFYTAVLLDAVGIDRAAFSGVFATGRVAGWLAHVDEQRRTGRMIRPRAAYVGPRPSTQ